MLTLTGLNGVALTHSIMLSYLTPIMGGMLGDSPLGKVRGSRKG